VAGGPGEGLGQARDVDGGNANAVQRVGQGGLRAVA
jgi:hypothetical protein